jgi:hypothetical protein
MACLERYVANWSANARLIEERSRGRQREEAIHIQLGASEDRLALKVRTNGRSRLDGQRQKVVESFTTSVPLAFVSLRHRHTLNPIQSAY